MALTKYTYNDALVLSDALGDYIGKCIEMVGKAGEHDDLVRLWRGRGEAATRLKSIVDMDLD